MYEQNINKKRKWISYVLFIDYEIILLLQNSIKVFYLVKAKVLFVGSKLLRQVIGRSRTSRQGSERHTGQVNAALCKASPDWSMCSSCNNWF